MQTKKPTVRAERITDKGKTTKAWYRWAERVGLGNHNSTPVTRINMCQAFEAGWDAAIRAERKQKGGKR